MKNLETKLIKNGLLDQFNEQLNEFIKCGVISPITDFPEMEMRGARTAPNVTNEQELRDHIKENPVTKRTCLAITMGTLHNPLYLMGPYLLNLKCLYRKVVQLGLDWDQRIPLTLELELFEI